MIDFEVGSDERIAIPEEFIPTLRLYRRQSRRLRVTISPVFEQRTKEQNAIFHARLKVLARLTGIKFDDLKTQVKGIAVEMGYPVEMGPNGELKVDARGNLIPLPSHKASISNMKILIDSLDQYCFDHGIDNSLIWQ